MSRNLVVPIFVAVELAQPRALFLSSAEDVGWLHVLPIVHTASTKRSSFL